MTQERIFNFVMLDREGYTAPFSMSHFKALAAFGFNHGEIGRALRERDPASLFSAIQTALYFGTRLAMSIGMVVSLDHVCYDIRQERRRQDEKFKHPAGVWPHSSLFRYVVLSEEFGEVCEAFAAEPIRNQYNELIHYTAVLTCWLEHWRDDDLAPEGFEACR